MDVYVRLCVLPQIAFVGSILDVVTDVVVHSMSCCAVSSIKNLQFEPKRVFLVLLLSSYTYYTYTMCSIQYSYSKSNSYN